MLKGNLCLAGHSARQHLKAGYVGIDNGSHMLRLHFSNLADALIQSDLKEQFALSAFFKGPSTDISPSWHGIWDSNLSVTGPTLLTARLPATLQAYWHSIFNSGLKPFIPSVSHSLPLHACSHTQNIPSFMQKLQQIWGEGSPGESTHGAASLAPWRSRQACHRQQAPHTFTGGSLVPTNTHMGVLCFAEQRDDPSQVKHQLYCENLLLCSLLAISKTVVNRHACEPERGCLLKDKRRPF